jgi:putative tryptophan/tyrosine transport system substrate-binding protein
MLPLTQELIALFPDVLFTGSLSGAQASSAMTRTIPIVMATPEDPVASKFAESIAKPGGNITGTWLLGDDELVGKRLDFLKLAVPGLARVGALINPEEPTDRVQTSKLETAARALGIDTKVFEVRDVTKLDAVAGEIARSGVQGLYVGHGPTLNTARVKAAALATRLKLPAIYGFREFADVGGLISYGPNLPDTYRQSARLVDRILKGRQAGRSAFRTARPVRADRQSQNGQSNRNQDSGCLRPARRRGHRIEGRCPQLAWSRRRFESRIGRF